MYIEKQPEAVDLGEGLVLRRATRADCEALAEFNGRIHVDEESDFNERIAAWTRDMMSESHPTLQPADFVLVEDTRARKVVASMNLISQTWVYEGIPIRVGQPEVVGSLPGYRRRGLVRQMFSLIHRMSEERGEIMQGISGIPYYYRQFGYEMAVDMGGGRSGYLPQVPKLAEGQQEPYRFRPAGEDDLPFIARLYERAGRRYLLRCVRDMEAWKYELNGRNEQNHNRVELKVIEDAGSGKAVGYLAAAPWLWGSRYMALDFEIESGYSWAAVAPSVIRYLFAQGKEKAQAAGTPDVFAAFSFWLGGSHPVYDVIPNHLPEVRQPYAWYVRVPDLPRFIQQIRPALEARLSDSHLSGYSGEIKISFYRSGLRLAFRDGHMDAVENWQPEPHGHSGDAAFPGLTFLQLLFGHRTLDELRYAFPDCSYRNDETYALLKVLFPRKPSFIWAIS